MCQTDNATVTWYADSSGKYALETPDKNVVKKVLSSQYSPTDLVIKYDSTPVFSGSAETDIVYQEGSDDVNQDGVTWCNDAVGTFQCDQQYIRIRGNGYYTSSLTATRRDMRSDFCTVTSQAQS